MPRSVSTPGSPARRPHSSASTLRTTHGSLPRLRSPETTPSRENHFPRGMPVGWKPGDGPPVPFPHSPYALQHAKDEQKGDRKVMLAACKKFGAALQYASPQLRADPELVLVASEKSPLPLQWADPKLWLDEDFMTACVK